MKTQNHIRRTATLLALSIAFTLVGRSPTSAGPLIYSTADKGALLVTTDFATGETKVIGPTGQILATGLACSGSGTLYTFTHAFDKTGESQLAKFDLTTGEARPYGEKNSLQFMGLTFTSDGTLLGAGWTDGALYSINLATGAPTKIGDLGDAKDVMDLTIHPNGNMYGIDEAGAIFQIDPKTAKATLAVKISGLDRPMGLGFDADGTGYVVGIVPQAPVYRIDLTTGQITGTVNTTLNFLHSAEFLVTPRSAGPLIYSTADKGALLVTTDFATGETKVIGPTGQILATGLACSASGTLYTFTHAFDKTGESQLAKFDLTTGEAKPYGEKNSLQFMGLTFTSDGTLLGAGWTDGALYSINLETGVPTKIGDLGDAKDVMDLTIHPNGNMYGIDEAGAIFQIDPKTAKATLAVKISGLDRPMGLGFDADGAGYVVGIVPQAPVYRIDLTTGQITGTVNTTLNFLHSAEFLVTRRPADEANHEVWMIEQSNTYDSDGNGTLDSGGTLYIYSFDGSELAGNAAAQPSPQKIDLGGAIAEWIKQATGTLPVRPHYVAFNPSHTHAIVSFVGSGHVLIFDASTRTPVFVVDVGAQAHAAEPSTDETYILVTNQNGKLLQRINTDYLHNAFALDAAATLDLATGTTPSGALKQDDAVTQVNVRPDNAPIMAMPDPTGTLAFVTLRGGGLFVVNPRVSPMAIVGEFTKATIQPAGLMAVMKEDTLYLNAGGGGATLGFQSILYRLRADDFSTTPILASDFPALVVVFDHNARPERDSHGMVLTKDERFLWVGDRAANRVIVVDTATDSVVNEINLAGNLSADPAPDFLALSPSGNRVYVALRGPNPLTANNTNVNNAKGVTPGLAVIQVEQAGMTGTLQALFAVSHLDGTGVERADPHGVAVRFRYLSIARSGNGVTISWPISVPEFVLEAATSLSPPAWQAATGVPTANAGKWQITDPANVLQRYFRLRKP